ncbi:RidA family protein [Limnothrix sp. FACHB-1083]|uniref:RidA family protein n=1 Tax=unclassified Limnothrix TaxID=2632864 RepID=UPI0016814AF9|nr:MULTISPECIES: RidA family protein [unclassified Limnothrix]MBD2159135.1 RidA family protein [Limnothrix sp. FACHB-1083]MBD2191840.1 RidA family protein [Limnothrix sp. FACHB-1088]
MPKQVIQTDKAPNPVGPYNQAIVANGMLFASGQISIDPATNQLVHEGDVVAQTERVLQNLEAVLEAGGTSFANVVKTTIFLANMDDFTMVNMVYAKYFSEVTAPARATVEVARLPKNVLVEIDCTAIVD